MTNVRYNTSGGRGPSTFWGPVRPWEGIDPSLGWGYFDDFLTFTATANNYTILAADSTVLLKPIQTESFGVLRLTADNTDNNEVGLQFGLATSAMGKIDAGAGRCWFEARIRTSSVADNVAGLCLGVAEEAFIAANFMADNTAAIADKDFIGFHTLQANGDSMNVIHNTASGGGVTTLISGALVPVVDTWYKLGFSFDGQKYVTFYVDGVPNATTVAESATNFPDGEEFSFVFGIKTGAATQFTADVDWWAYAQEVV